MSATIDLCRSVQFIFERATDTPGDGLTLEGYAAVFDQATEIDSWEGCFNESIRKGAFKKSIRERTPVLQFDHGRHPLVGSIPIGAITELREDEKGLYVSARITDNWLMQPVRDAIANESVNGMSFRFSVIRDEWRDSSGKLVQPTELADLLWNPGDRGPLERTLIELRVAELGPVVFPAYEGTSVGVRAADIAATFRTDGDLRRELCRSLAGAVPPGKGVLPADNEELRGEVARALLFPTISETAPPEKHPVEEPERSDAPPEGHPPENKTDAPLEKEHPSPTTREARMKAVRLAYVTRNGVRK